MMWLGMSCPHPLPPVNATLKSPVLPAVDLLPEFMAVVSEGVKGQAPAATKAQDIIARSTPSGPGVALPGTVEKRIGTNCFLFSM